MRVSECRKKVNVVRAAARVVNSPTGITNVSLALFIQCLIFIFARPTILSRAESKKRVEVGFGVIFYC